MTVLSKKVKIKFHFIRTDISKPCCFKASNIMARAGVLPACVYVGIVLEPSTSPDMTCASVSYESMLPSISHFQILHHNILNAIMFLYLCWALEMSRTHPAIIGPMP